MLIYYFDEDGYVFIDVGLYKSFDYDLFIVIFSFEVDVEEVEEEDDDNDFGGFMGVILVFMVVMFGFCCCIIVK